MSHKDFLFELGCEELPPKALRRLAEALTTQVAQGLEEAQFEFSVIQPIASPRRLGFKLKQCQVVQADQTVRKQGPFVQAAFDAQGKPTPAAEGFARSCGVQVDALARETTEKGERLTYATVQSGQMLQNIIPDIIHQALKQLPIPKMMRWGSAKEAFVRPVHWCVMLLDDEVIDATFFSVTTNRVTYGHRFHHPQAITLACADQYDAALLDAHVMVDFEVRKQTIVKAIAALAKQHELVIETDDALLDEVTAIVEWPVPLFCTFEPEFLRLPKEVLVSSLRDHQKCFHVQNDQGQCQAGFVTVSNIDSRDKAQVREGNQRVVRARLNDAAFFYQADCQQPLVNLLPRLNDVTYQQQLGSLGERVARISALSQSLAPWCDVDVALATRAAQCAKCDLLTLMVGEFPELQGTMGKYYARQSGEPDAVAVAIEEHYFPRFAEDQLPMSPLGSLLAVAERLEKLVGIFGINQLPSGEKDPFALRRAALGLVRIIIENQLPLNLLDCLTATVKTFKVPLVNEQVVEQVHQFILERMRIWYADSQQIQSDVFAAVCARENSLLLDMHQRLQAVKNFRSLESATALAAANKRVSRLLVKEGAQDTHQTIQSSLLQSDEEKRLAQMLQDKQSQVSPLFAAGQYNEALQVLADLREPVDLFFDNVMVMVDEDALRNNRLALLTQLRQLFLEVADISLLQ